MTKKRKFASKYMTNSIKSLTLKQLKDRAKNYKTIIKRNSGMYRNVDDYNLFTKELKKVNKEITTRKK
tara:strand:- start:3081 stop:3284 length:204 start_codon:yes stop_codon:yes gene_type:complete